VLAGEARQVKSGLVKSGPARSSQVGGGQTRRWRGSRRRRRRTERGQSWRRPYALTLALARHAKAGCIGAIAFYISSASPQAARLPVPGQSLSSVCDRKKSEHRKQASSAARSPLALPIAVRAVVAQRLEKLSISRFHRVRISTVSNAPCVPSGPPWMPSLVVEPLCHLRRYTSPSDRIEPVAWAKKKKIPSSSALRGNCSSHTRLPGHHVCRPVAMHRLVLCLLITAPGLKPQYALPRLLPACAVSSPVSTSSCLGT
jgi:hypothetical protein